MINPKHITRSQNIMFVAQKNTSLGNLPESLPAHSAPLILEEMKLDLSIYASNEEYLLTDDHAPIERLMMKQR